MNGLTRLIFPATVATSFLVTGFSVTAYSAEPIEVMLHETDVVGARDIETGNYSKGVERLEARLHNGAISHSARTPIVIDLCAGYTMLEDFEAAEKICDDAVERGWSKGLALNNRGALHVARGDYESAIRDFQAAIDSHGADSIARRNLNRIEAKVAAMRAPSDSSVAFVTLDAE